MLRRLGDLQRVGRGGLFAHEVLLARELQLGQHELRLPVGELRLLVEQLRLVAVDFGLVDRGVDLGEELPLALTMAPTSTSSFFSCPETCVPTSTKSLGWSVPVAVTTSSRLPRTATAVTTAVSAASSANQNCQA